MGLFLRDTQDNKDVLGRRYNVEYELGNGKIATMSNILENADGVYFWFCSKEDGLSVIKQKRVLTMVCVK